MTEHLVLIFAYHFPPENEIGGARPFRFSKYLSRLGYTCRVFTASEQTGRDDSNTEYVPDPFVTHSRHRPSWQLERAIRKVILPGEFGTQWSCYAANAARVYVRAHPGACLTIFSTFPPLGSHLAAWQLARGGNAPWIADFRDPMRNERLGGSFINRFRKQVDLWLEHVLVRRADAVIANTDPAMVRLREKFPCLNGKVHSIWNGFDPEERVSPSPASPDDCRVLSHTGDLYGGRSAVPILESIARLIGSGRLSSRHIRVRLIGDAEAGMLPKQAFLDRARAAGWLELVTERIPQREAVQIARSSDGLLLIQLRSAVHVPAKIFEYVQIGRPVLAFIQPDSPAERLLERSGVPYRCVYPGSTPEEIDNTVADFFRIPPNAVAASAWFEEQFNAENQTRQLDAIIRSLHEKLERDAKPSPELLVPARHITANQNITGRRKMKKAAPDRINRA